jgi:hypothetical protein
VLTGAAAADTEAPTLQVTSPAAGQNFNGAVNVAWTASDASSGISSSFAVIDSGTAGSELATPGSVTLAPGPHTVDVFAEDRAGNMSTRHITFQVASQAGSGSLALNGSTAFADVAAAPELNLTGSWTVEGWFKDQDPGGFNHDYRQILNKGDRNASSESPYYVTLGYNSILAGVRTAGTDYPITFDLAVAGLSPTQWHHVAVTFRGDLNVLNLWVDGVHRGYRTVPTHSAVGNSLPLQIGRNGPTSGKYWRGLIDDVRIWNVARSGTDITATFRTELTTAPSGLVANWRFNDGGGATASDLVAGRVATLRGGASFSSDVHP